MELEKLIHQHAEKLSELDRGILNFILSDPSLIQNLKITDLAERLYVSKSSIMRTTKKLGFSGYSEFKYFLRHVTNKENGLRTKEDIFEKQLEDIQQTLHYMKAVNLKPILQCLDRSKMIYCYATGFSQKKVINEFYKMMLGIGKRVMVLPNKTEFDMAMPLITLEDMAIIVSLSGETHEVKENLTAFELQKIPVLTITAAGDNYFTRHSTYHLNYYCNCFILGKENKPFQSLISLSCLADYLVRAYGVYTLREES